MSKIVKKFAYLCDYAIEGADKKMSTIGIFDNINSKDFPIKHPQLFLVANFQNVPNGEYKITIKLFNEANDAVLENPLEYIINITSKDSGRDDNDFNIIARFIELEFKSAGEYYFIISINDDYKERVRFNVKKPTL